jgi:formate-dependent phosphoribosylglycinamide formyltransferase (GAR transformylase)
MPTFAHREKSNNRAMKNNRPILNSDFKVGVLGGGQLGKMLALAAADWHLPLYFLDASPDFPAGPFSARFESGNFNDYDDVMRFGRGMDVLTIEIEHVHTGALKELEKAGVIVHPSPEKLEIIKDKGLQKLFYKEHGLPASGFEMFDDEQAVAAAVEMASSLSPSCRNPAPPATTAAAWRSSEARMIWNSSCPAPASWRKWSP